MPTKKGNQTRAEKSAANKAAYAVALRESAQRGKDISAVLDPYRERPTLAPGLVNGNTRRRKRGDRTDKDCIEELCELIASGITCAKAREFIGISKRLWYKWKRENPYALLENYALARQCALELKEDEMIDIADEPINDPEFDANGNLKPGSMSVSDQLRLREMRIKIRQWQIKRLDPWSDR